MDRNNMFIRAQQRSQVVVTPSMEQQSIDVYKGIGNAGAAGPNRSQADITVPNDVVHVPSSSSR